MCPLCYKSKNTCYYHRRSNPMIFGPNGRRLNDPYRGLIWELFLSDMHPKCAHCCNKSKNTCYYNRRSNPMIWGQTVAVWLILKASLYANFFLYEAHPKLARCGIRWKQLTPMIEGQMQKFGANWSPFDWSLKCPYMRTFSCMRRILDVPVVL